MMSAAKLKKLVDRVKKLNDDGDPDLVAEEILSEIVEGGNPEAICLLLTMRPAEEDWDYDEMAEIESAVAEFPPEAFAPQFAKLAAELSRSTPTLFGHLMSQVIGFCLDEFITSVASISAADRRHLHQAIAKKRADSGPHTESVDAKFSRLLAALETV
jgi:hypothetical protein